MPGWGTWTPSRGLRVGGYGLATGGRGRHGLRELVPPPGPPDRVEGDDAIECAADCRGNRRVDPAAQYEDRCRQGRTRQAAQDLCRVRRWLASFLEGQSDEESIGPGRPGRGIQGNRLWPLYDERQARARLLPPFDDHSGGQGDQPLQSIAIRRRRSGGQPRLDGQYQPRRGRILVLADGQPAAPCCRLPVDAPRRVPGAVVAEPMDLGLALDHAAPLASLLIPADDGPE